MQTDGEEPIDIRNNQFSGPTAVLGSGTQINLQINKPPADAIPIDPLAYPLVQDVDALELGIHRTRHDSDLPPLTRYVRRDVDLHAQARIQEASENGGFVLLHGDSTAGKSRTAFESMRAKLVGFRVIAPTRGVDLRQIAAALERASGRYVLWLDDIDGYLGTGGLDPSLLKRFIARRVVVIATIRDEKYEHYRPHAARSLNRNSDSTSHDLYIGAQILNMVNPIHVPRLWSRRELTIAALINDPRLAEALARRGSSGIAEYLAAGPQLWDEWRQSFRIGGSPRGGALVAAAIDIARVGLHGPIPESLLCEVHEHYLENMGGDSLQPEDIASAFQWASQVRYGITSMLQPVGDNAWRVFDYLVDATARQTHAPPIPAYTWDAVINCSSRDALAIIGLVANSWKRKDLAERAWRKGAVLEEPWSMANLGALLAERGSSEAERWCRDAAEAGSELGAYNLAILLADRGEIEAAEKLFEHAADKGMPEAALNLGNLLADQGRTEEAAHRFRQASDHGSPLGSMNLAIRMEEEGRLKEAEAYYRQAADFGHSEANLFLGNLLSSQERDEAAETWWRRSVALGEMRAVAALVSLLIRQERFREAKDILRNAAEAGDAQAALRLGDVLASDGEFSEAERWWLYASGKGEETAGERSIFCLDGLRTKFDGIVIDREFLDKLGISGLEDLARNVWPVDCQTCGKPLAGAVPSLCVVDVYFTARASLHHCYCRQPGWVTGGLLASAKHHLSWRSLPVVVGINQHGKVRPLPFLLVNPSLEEVTLRLHDRGLWECATMASLERWGFSSSRTMAFLDKPLPITPLIRPVVEFVGGDIVVTAIPGEQWSAPVGDEFVRIARSINGVYVGVTSAINPHDDLSMDELEPLLSGGQIAMGWIPFGRKREEMRRGVGQIDTYLLNWIGEHASVGRLLGTLERDATFAEAKDWTIDLIGQPSDQLIFGEEIEGGRICSIMDKLNLTHYILRLHHGCWYLIKAFSIVPGAWFESDAKSVDWGTSVIFRRTSIVCNPWEVVGDTNEASFRLSFPR